MTSPAFAFLAFLALADPPAAPDLIDRRSFRLLGLGGFLGLEGFPAALAPGSPFLYSSLCHNFFSYLRSQQLSRLIFKHLKRFVI